MANLYCQLGDKREEVRLLTLQPNSHEAGIIQCSLEIYALDDFKPEYRQFLATSADAGLSRHQKISLWTHHQTASTSISTAPPKHGHATEPPPSHHRFRWGDYAALSYVWGDENNTTPILVNGQELCVTRNLEKALQAFSRDEEFQGGFKLWVDAISINQADLDERAKQVRRMREIYGNARTVIAWMGEESHKSDLAIQLLKDLAVLDQNDGGEQLAARLRADPEYLGKGCWFGLQRLFERPYWFRLWVIQEMVMGASATWIRCGAASIDWESFCGGVGLIAAHLWQIKDGLLKRETIAEGFKSEDVTSMANKGLIAPEVLKSRMKTTTTWTTPTFNLINLDLSVLSKSDERGGDYLSFGRLLDIAHAAHCRDPRDKVYALVGLMPPSVARQMVPNYSEAPSKVYAATARIFIQAYDNLEPVREGNPWGPTGGPSWAADWQWVGRIRWARTETQLPGPLSFFPLGESNTSFDVPYRASGTSKHDTSISDDGMLLTCSGFIVDTISGLSARRKGFFEWSKRSIVNYESWTSIYGDRQATAEALCRTLVLDRVEGGKRANDRHFAVFHLPSTFDAGYKQFRDRGWTWLSQQRGYYFRWSRFREANQDFRLGPYRFDDFFDDEIPPDASEFDYSEVYAGVDRSGKKRRLMTTRGGYMGLAPDNAYGGAGAQTRPGDFIAVLFGCSTPIVIRPHGSYFQVLGEAYVQGLMDGEAMELFGAGKFDTQTFTFR
jgi:hypothetical protein